MEFRKMAMTIFMQGSKWDIDVKNRHLDSVGEGEGGMTWEYSIEKCILPYVKQMTNESSMHEAGHTKPVLWDSPEGWGREGGGRGSTQNVGTHVYLWLIHVDICQETTLYHQGITFQLELIN